MTITVVLLVLFCMVTPAILFYLGTEAKTATRRNALYPVVTALENYKKDRGYYPDSVEFLKLSGHIESLPETEFSYNLLDSGNYTLCFKTDWLMLLGESHANMDCNLECYSSVSKQWDKSACY
jgi:hypothetical protein